MDTPHLVHLIFVGVITLAILIGMGVWLRKSYPRSWWIQLVIFFVIMILAGGKFSFR